MCGCGQLFDCIYCSRAVLKCLRMFVFLERVEESNLMGISGPLYTWLNTRETLNGIKYPIVCLYKICSQQLQHD